MWCACVVSCQLPPKPPRTTAHRGHARRISGAVVENSSPAAVELLRGFVTDQSALLAPGRRMHRMHTHVCVWWTKHAPPATATAGRRMQPLPYTARTRCAAQCTMQSCVMSCVLCGGLCSAMYGCAVCYGERTAALAAEPPTVAPAHRLRTPPGYTRM